VKLVFCCLALGALPALAQVPDGASARVAVYVGFQHQPPGSVLDSLESEVVSILSPMGARIEWRSLDAVRLGDSADELAVVRFMGNCDPERPAFRSDPGALGFTHVSDGVVLPFCEVDCDRIRSFLSRALVPLQIEDRAGNFGRAVGRVLSHELYHIFARTSHHWPLGLAKAALSVKDLTAGEFRLPEGAIRPLAAFAGTRPPAAPPAGESIFSERGCIGCHGARREGTGRGPALRARLSHLLDSAGLCSRLGNKRSAMFRRASAVKVAWPSLTGSDLDDLVGYLNSPPE
jgi:hypothetical protein